MKNKLNRIVMTLVASCILMSSGLGCVTRNGQTTDISGLSRWAMPFAPVGVQIAGWSWISSNDIYNHFKRCDQ